MLFEAPAVAELAIALQGPHRPDDALAPVLPLRRSGTAPALFCVHPAGGLSWCYSGLISHLAPGRPLYGLQAHGLADPARPPGTLADLAASYADEIMAVQAHGPYHLLGWSFGGTAAHAVALRLQELGHQVGLLALLDSSPMTPADDDLPEETDSMILAALLAEGDLAGDARPPGTQEPPGAQEPAELTRTLATLRERGSALGSLSEATVRSMISIYRNDSRLMRSHSPAAYRGDAVHFTATKGRPPSLPNGEALWRPYVQGVVEDHLLECTHIGLITPGALTYVAKIISQRISAAESSGT